MRRVVLLLLAAALVVAAAARLYRLGDRTMTHPEAYVPAIPLPADVFDPPQRMTALEVLDSGLSIDIHPPGYHLIMLAWNRTFGTGLWAIRSSSVLFGLLALLGVFAYARRHYGASAALAAAWLLALHGGHVYWSQSARPWVLLSLIGVASIVLLHDLNQRWRLRTALAYTLVSTCGLWVDYYYWPLFAMQVAWVVLERARDERLPRALAAQTAALMLAVPVFIYLWEHMARSTHLGGPLMPYVLQMLQFGGILAAANYSAEYGRWAVPLGWLVAAAGGTALILGLRRRTEAGDQTAALPDREADGSALTALVGAAAIASATVELVFAQALGIGHRKIIVATLVLPWLVLAAWLAARALWPELRRPARWLTARVDARLVSMPALMAVGVFAIMALMHLRKPLLIQYALISFTPLWVAPMAAGIMSAGRARHALFGGALVLAAFTTVTVAHTPNSARDYQGVAHQLTPQIRSGDLIWMRRGWFSTAMHYYLTPDRYDVAQPPLPEKAPERLRQAQSAERIWVIAFGEDAIIQRELERVGALVPQHRPTRRLSAHHAAAVLFTRAGPP